MLETGVALNVSFEEAVGSSMPKIGAYNSSIPANVLDKVGVLIMVLDIDGRIVYFNHACERASGYKFSEVKGRCLCELLVRQEDMDELKRLFNNILSGRVSEPVIYEYYWVSKSGSERLIAWSNVELSKDNSSELFIISTGIDVTDINLKNQLLVQQSKMACMGEMIGMITHQWVQPLNAIGLSVQDLQDAYACGEIDEKYIKGFVDMAIGQVNFMSDTISDFKNFYVPSKKKILFNVKNTLEELISMFIRIFNGYGIDIYVTAEKDTKLFTEGYPNEFKQVILNILNNSKDAIISKRGKGIKIRGQIEINICNDKKRDKMIVSVRDNGGGILDNVIGNIFEPYFTTKGKEGTGVGLYMSKTIVETNMGGSLTVRNYGGGAEFTISLNIVGGSGVNPTGQTH
ncbi:ATP-binding protein [Candidatus Magnetominusculus dajiuhuensis]|uniref:PAS domain-containing sensor histidine kinase n=1 Tax=Candidatus Magnetominusculus dajiuhuensis TaxID=3137712 RepID=UPI003B42B02C